ncbi:unnamed protein product [Rotaria sordida]|uniref:Uncharacterized protein n=1 Tax=Rotaria sordida TaxID=392033 RepID=A0A819U682_9BILA|nr:unnamed protein product [Rotaria sordida]
MIKSKSRKSIDIEKLWQTSFLTYGDKCSSFFRSNRRIFSSLPPFPESALSKTTIGCSIIVGIGIDSIVPINSFIDVGRFVVDNDGIFLDVSTLFLIPLTPTTIVGVHRPFDVIFGFIDGSEFLITIFFGND